MNSVRALEGRFHLVQDWVFDYALKDKKSISAEDRAVFKEEQPELVIEQFLEFFE